jgi:hypothetical protein
VAQASSLCLLPVVDIFGGSLREAANSAKI